MEHGAAPGDLVSITESSADEIAQPKRGTLARIAKKHSDLQLNSAHFESSFGHCAPLLELGESGQLVDDTIPSGCRTSDSAAKWCISSP